MLTTVDSYRRHFSSSLCDWVFSGLTIVQSQVSQPVAAPFQKALSFWLQTTVERGGWTSARLDYSPEPASCAMPTDDLILQHETNTMGRIHAHEFLGPIMILILTSLLHIISLGHCSAAGVWKPDPGTCGSGAAIR